MSSSIQAKKIAILVDDGFEQVELTSPKHALEDAGAVTFVVSPQPDYVRAWAKTDWGDDFDVDIPLAEGESLTRAVVLAIGAVEESIQVTPGGPPAAAVPMTELDRVLAARASPATPVGTSGRCASPGPCVTPALKVIDRQPQYAPEAVNLGTEGEVILQGRITRDGVVDDIKPLMSADDSLKESVLAAVRQWQYKPTLLNGVAVEAPLTISVQFSRTSDRR